jgi:hypothetical protein
MATSGTTAFNLDFTEIAEEAWERAGREMRSGYDLRTARRSMNLLTIEWQNRGINMWTIEEGTSKPRSRHCHIRPASRHYRFTRARSAHRRREYHYPV